MDTSAHGYDGYDDRKIWIGFVEILEKICSSLNGTFRKIFILILPERYVMPDGLDLFIILLILWCKKCFKKLVGEKLL